MSDQGRQRDCRGRWIRVGATAEITVSQPYPIQKVEGERFRIAEVDDDGAVVERCLDMYIRHAPGTFKIVSPPTKAEAREIRAHADRHTPAPCSDVVSNTASDLTLTRSALAGLLRMSGAAAHANAREATESPQVVAMYTDIGIEAHTLADRVEESTIADLSVPGAVDSFVSLARESGV